MATKNKLECYICKTKPTSVECINCVGPFCRNCDENYHKDPSYPSRLKHIRKIIGSSIFAQCNCCGSESVEYFCLTCEEHKLFCGPCDCLFHSRQERQGHDRKQLCRPSSSLIVDDGIHCCHCHSICTVECKECSKTFCSKCDEKYHHHPNFERHTRKELKRMCNMCDEVCATMRCDDCDGWYCNTCDEARHRLRRANHERKIIQESNTEEETTCERNDQLSQYIAELEQQKAQKDMLKRENMSLQNYISTLENQVTNKDALLLKYVPQNKAGVWTKVSNGYVPVDAVLSQDCWIRSKEYVCRLQVEGDVVPGYIYPYQKMCWVFHNGKHHRQYSYEVLTPFSAFEWVYCHKDYIPPHAVPGGKMADGEILYIGRVKFADGWYRVGKVQLSMKGCYSKYFTVYNNYEILVWK